MSRPPYLAAGAADPGVDLASRRPRQAVAPAPGIGRIRRSRLSLAALLATALLLLSACQPLYIPPVPTPLELPERLELDAQAGLDGQRPRVSVELLNIPEEGWLAVQWFSPNNRESASESVWITPADENSTMVLQLPSDVEAGSGRWRAVLSMDDRVLRQLSIEVP